MKYELQHQEYIKPFDGLRAIAVIFVILSHWFPRGLINRLNLGAIGVDMFFVLSGFLITRILLIKRNKIDLQPQQNVRCIALKNFIIRRSLRIFPLYYVVLFSLILFKNIYPNSVAQNWKWFFLYGQNFLIFKNQAWAIPRLTHLWSLAVEEQFYLFWPCIILFLPRRLLLFSFSIFFILGVSFVYYFGYIGLNSVFSNFLLVTCFQSFATGGILAFIYIYSFQTLKKNEYYLYFLSLFLCIFLLACLFGVCKQIIDLRTLVSIIMFGGMTFIMLKPTSLFNVYFLNNPVMSFLGRISYGLYILHNPIPDILNNFIHYLEKDSVIFLNFHYSVDLNNQSFSFYLVSLFILLAISTFSFYFFEQKILKFKNHFNL